MREYEEDGNVDLEGEIAFALTINKAQGQSAGKCGVLLPKDVWTHGQIYVAFSRSGNPNNVFVWAESSRNSPKSTTCLPERNM